MGMFYVSSAGMVPIVSFLILRSYCSLRNAMVMEGNLKHCVAKAQRWEGIWMWWKGMWHMSLNMWLLSIHFRLMGISVERLPPEMAPLLFKPLAPCDCRYIRHENLKKCQISHQILQVWLSCGPHGGFRHVDSLRNMDQSAMAVLCCTLALLMPYNVKSGDISGVEAPIPGTVEIENIWST